MKGLYCSDRFLLITTNKTTHFEEAKRSTIHTLISTHKRDGDIESDYTFCCRHQESYTLTTCYIKAPFYMLSTPQRSLLFAFRKLTSEQIEGSLKYASTYGYVNRQ